MSFAAPRQYSKSTWLEYQLRETIKQFGPGTALFLNGDYIAGPDELEREIEALLRHFPAGNLVRRLFIDEITAVSGWQRAIKRLADSGALRSYSQSAHHPKESNWRCKRLTDVFVIDSAVIRS